MKSLVVLMMEEEQPEGLSARKLIAETAKHNVLTGYNAEDGLKLLRRFPNVDVVLVHSSLLDSRKNLLAEIKAQVPGLPIILVSPFRTSNSKDAQYHCDSHRPQELLQLLNDTIPVHWHE